LAPRLPSGNPVWVRLRPALIIGTASLLNVLAGVVLKEADADSSAGLVIGALALAGILGVIQFLLWRNAHHRYPLSLTYPYTGLVFPFALVISALYGEPVKPAHVMATALIVAGVIIVHKTQLPDQESHS